jgi:type IV pilus assembly protein PilW
MELAKRNKGNLRSGFSLVELLVAMAITGAVMAAVFKIYTTQQDSYVLQEQVAEMQQNGRTAKYVMTREIRMAGYDPTGSDEFGFLSASDNSIRFAMDIEVENGDRDLVGEVITYSVSANEELLRNEGSGDLIVVENIEAVGFAYAYDEDNDGDVETCGSDMKWAIDSDGDDFLDLNLDTNGDCKIDISDDADNDGSIDGTAITPTVSVENIRAVKIWLLAKTGHTDRNYTSADKFMVGKTIITTSDGNRRQLLATTVKCRNMAL